MHSERNGEGGAGPVEQPLTWDDEDVVALRGFLPSQDLETRCSFPRCLQATCEVSFFLLFFVQVVAKQ